MVEEEVWGSRGRGGALGLYICFKHIDEIVTNAVSRKSVFSNYSTGNEPIMDALFYLPFFRTATYFFKQLVIKIAF